MNFSTTRTLDNNVFSTKIKCTGYGDNTMTATEEEALIKDLGPIIVDVGGQFTNKCDIVNQLVVIDPVAGEAVDFVLNSLKVELKTDVSIDFSIDANKFSADELAKYTKFADKFKLAEARCAVFESAIKDRVIAAATAIKAKATKFETVVIDPFQA
jgi:hypothetical protein